MSLWAWPVMALFWVGVILLVVWAVRALSGSGPRSQNDGAMELLKRRLASGEITQDEYERTRRLLQG